MGECRHECTRRTWADFTWPDWVPQDCREQVEGFWSDAWGRGPDAWLAAAQDPYNCRDGVEFGERVTLRGVCGDWGKDEVTGRYVYAWNNIGRIVTDDGRTVCVANGRKRPTPKEPAHPRPRALGKAGTTMTNPMTTPPDLTKATAALTAERDKLQAEVERWKRVAQGVAVLADDRVDAVEADALQRGHERQALLCKLGVAGKCESATDRSRLARVLWRMKRERDTLDFAFKRAIAAWDRTRDREDSTRAEVEALRADYLASHAAGAENRTKVRLLTSEVEALRGALGATADRLSHWFSPGQPDAPETFVDNSPADDEEVPSVFELAELRKLATKGTL